MVAPPPKPPSKGARLPPLEDEEIEIDLDIEFEETAGAASPEPVASAGPDAPAVLVVDDDPAIRAMLVRTLALNYTVYEAADGEEAAAVVPRLPMLRVIVCDVMMPRLDGIAFAKRLKADNSIARIPIIFLTAKDGALDVVQGINAGARHYMTKPFKMKELMDKVASVISGSGHAKAR